MHTHESFVDALSGFAREMSVSCRSDNLRTDHFE